MDDRTELQMLRRLQALEAKAAGQGAPPAAPAAPAAPQAPPDIASDMNWGERALVGAGGATRRAYLGVRSMIPGLGLDQDEKDELALYDKYKGQLNQKGDIIGAGTAGEIGADLAMTAIPGTWGMRGAQWAGRGLRALSAASPGMTAARAAGMALENPLVAGGLSGAATAGAVSPEDRGTAALWGGIGGAAGEGIARTAGAVAGGVLRGPMSADAQALAAQGVNVPFWKAYGEGGAGGYIRNLAERARAGNITGTRMQMAERGALEDWNRSLLNRAAPPTPIRDPASGSVVRWEAPTPVQNVGHEGMAELKGRFDDVYDTLYAGRSIPIDQQLHNDINAVVQNTRAYRPGAAPDVEGGVREAMDLLTAGTQPNVQTQVIRQGGPLGSGRISARIQQPQITQTTTQLGHAAVDNSNVKRALDALDANITSQWRIGDETKARALQDVRDAIANLRERNMPADLQNILPDVNNAYRTFKTMQRATSTLGANRAGGVVNPSQLQNAIRARDANKTLWSMEQAPLQQEANLAQRVLGSRLPEVGPGTAEKLMAYMTPYAGAAGISAMGQMLGTDYGYATLLATPAGQRFLMGQLRGQQGIRNMAPRIAQALRTMSVAAAAGRRNKENQDAPQ